MAKDKIKPGDITFRQAAPEDAKAASRLMFETFPQKATFIIGLGDELRAKRILERLFKIPRHRLSYSTTQLVIHQGQIIGLFTSFPGFRLSKLDRRLDFLILRQYALRGKIAVFLRGWPLFFIKEAGRKEYFVSNIAVKKRQRGRGIGEITLSEIEALARGSGFKKISLMVAIENQAAKRLYERNGFRTAAIHLETNKRLPYLGAGYQRMVKDLGE